MAAEAVAGCPPTGVWVRALGGKEGCTEGRPVAWTPPWDPGCGAADSAEYGDAGALGDGSTMRDPEACHQGEPLPGDSVVSSRSSRSPAAECEWGTVWRRADTGNGRERMRTGRQGASVHMGGGNRHDSEATVPRPQRWHDTHPDSQCNHSHHVHTLALHQQHCSIQQQPVPTTLPPPPPPYPPRAARHDTHPAPSPPSRPWSRTPTPWPGLGTRPPSPPHAPGAAAPVCLAGTGRAVPAARPGPAEPQERAGAPPTAGPLRPTGHCPHPPRPHARRRSGACQQYAGSWHR